MITCRPDFNQHLESSSSATGDPRDSRLNRANQPHASDIAKQTAVELMYPFNSNKEIDG